jgi:type I restriction enzyme R subunit
MYGGRFPRDEEFRSAFLVRDVYNFRSRNYLLRKLENYSQKELVNIESCTIEHIMPQNEQLSTVWQEELGPNWQEIHEKYLHTIGNLTLTGYNSELSDHSFQEKRDMEGGFAHSPIRLNNGLARLEHWNKEEIERRAESLAELAVKVWPISRLSPEQISKYSKQLGEIPSELIGPIEYPVVGYETANTFHEKLGKYGTLGRETEDEVLLVPRLRIALQRLNPDVPYEAIELAIEELTRDRSALSPANANREIYQLLKQGIPIRISASEDAELVEVVRVIDWNDPKNNDFFLASQFWISGEMYRKRADLVGFVNGLPLIFIELKTAHKRVEDAFHDNLRDYKDTIPQIFWYNDFIILSNGHQSRIGSMTPGWEHFFEWKKISDEQEKGVVSLETMIRGTCEKNRLLDIVENFTLFNSAGGAFVKLIAKNHQFLGVNNALEAVRSLGENQGRLGVFWHTQGSGKSYSMVFFSQKVLRKIRGNWTFLIVTDRQELDDQIYKTFQNVGAVTEIQVQAESGDHLKQLLQEDHRNIFTLIHKFHTEKGQNYPKLSDRSDIIVMTDEAHRTQYDILALNMRNALPNAAFIGFTGTPLMVGEEKTRKVFGDYVSIYNFRQSVEDVELNEGQQRRLEREFAREYQLITRDERLEKIAEDIVTHFMSRGQMGKAMVISIDKATAVRMYNKVQHYWQLYLDELKKQLAGYAVGQSEWQLLQKKIAYMQNTDMAVVISKSQNEIDDLRRKGLDIIPHRRRMEHEDLETKFKEADDPLRIVFVCAMWITGFDVPSPSTLYLDKPMRNHTLMQTIARSNRVFLDKVDGLIVDYAGVFRDLQKALAI